ncbi:MAG: hypothetical protein AAFY15_11835, partial [Cyanobacteria bacterium J06648_11]
AEGASRVEAHRAAACIVGNELLYFGGQAWTFDGNTIRKPLCRQPVQRYLLDGGGWQETPGPPIHPNPSAHLD